MSTAVLGFVFELCEQADIHYNKYAAGCGTDDYGIYTDLGDILEFNSEGFASVQANPVRLFLMDLPTFMQRPGSLVLNSVEPTQFTVQDGSKIDAYHLRGTYIAKDFDHEDDFLVTFSPLLPSLAQPYAISYRPRCWGEYMDPL